MNLKTIPHMKKAFNCTVGLSDHTLGTAVSVTAVSLGAEVIERHFILSRRNRTPDSFFSIEPAELKQLVENVRIAKEAIGGVSYKLTRGERKSRVFRRSLFAVRDIRKGEVFSDFNVRSIRPSDGLAPKYIGMVIGKRARRSINKGAPLSWGAVL
jgi:sialic acid synthase SpsE